MRELHEVRMKSSLYIRVVARTFSRALSIIHRTVSILHCEHMSFGFISFDSYTIIYARSNYDERPYKTSNERSVLRPSFLFHPSSSQLSPLFLLFQRNYIHPFDQILLSEMALISSGTCICVANFCHESLHSVFRIHYIHLLDDLIRQQ